MNTSEGPILFLTNLVHNTISSKKNVQMAEIGVWDGGTTVSYIQALKDNGGHAYIIDWFSGNFGHPEGLHAYRPDNKHNIKNQFMANIKELNCEDCITLYDMHSHEAAKYIPDNSLDICFIDASHAYSDVIGDIKLYLPKVKQGGVICGHDCQDIFAAGGPGSFTSEELEKQGTYKGHVGVMQAVYDMFGTDVQTNIQAVNGGQGCNLWCKQL